MTLRKWLGLLTALALPFVLSGCMMTASVEELYALPKLPVEYQALSAQIEAILAGGAETVSPTGGANLQSVQLEDIDGDGQQEAVAFFRKNGDERPMKIYIFRTREGAYEQAALIEGSGTSIHSIRYLDMNGDGGKEVLVSWRVGAQVQALSVYKLDDLQPELLMSVAYAKYEVIDMDGDNILELVVLRGDETETGGSLADYYDWDGAGLVQRSGARLSVAVGELQWMQEGKLSDGEVAVFVTGRVAGAEETSRAVMDILICREGELCNIVMDQATGVSGQIARFLNLQPADIDGDGVTEVPMPAALPTAEGEEEKWKIYWYSYNADGVGRCRVITYHHVNDSWYLIIPDTWDGRFTVKQDNTAATERVTTFYRLRGESIYEELFSIYTLTGENREAQILRGSRSILRRQPNAVYAIRYADNYADWRYAVDPEDMVGRFNAITAQWGTEE